MVILVSVTKVWMPKYCLGALFIKVILTYWAQSYTRPEEGLFSGLRVNFCTGWHDTSGCCHPFMLRRGVRSPHLTSSTLFIEDLADCIGLGFYFLDEQPCACKPCPNQATLHLSLPAIMLELLRSSPSPIRFSPTKHGRPTETSHFLFQVMLTQTFTINP